MELSYNPSIPSLPYSQKTLHLTIEILAHPCLLLDYSHKRTDSVATSTIEFHSTSNKSEVVDQVGKSIESKSTVLVEVT